MLAQVKRWGNSLGVKMPKKIADKVHIKEGSNIDIKVSNNKVIITSGMSDKIYNRLNNLDRAIGRKRSYLVKKAVRDFLEEQEDYFIALRRLEEKNPRISLEQLEADNDLENTI